MVAWDCFWARGRSSGPHINFHSDGRTGTLFFVKFVAAGLGSGYTVEEQITGKAEIGGFQFDVFPRRPSVNGKFFHHGEQLNSISSPSELGLAEGDQFILER
jgi:hypothetical protein